MTYWQVLDFRNGEKHIANKGNGANTISSELTGYPRSAKIQDFWKGEMGNEDRKMREGKTVKGCE